MMIEEKKPLRILLVEDSKLVAEQTRELLQTVASAVEVAATEKEALGIAMSMVPDVIILDLHLKQGTGFGVLKALKTVAHGATVIVLTNYALPKYRDLALLTGAHYFLDKALDFENLPGIIELISQSRASPKKA